MPPSLSRTVRLAEDLDWLPAHVRALRWVAGVLGDRPGGRVVERHVTGRTRDVVALDGLRDRDEGAPVRVRGRVQLLDGSLTGALHGTPGVARRMIFATSTGRWVHEAACDFALVDDAGARVFVRVAGARILVAPGELVSYPAARVLAALPAHLAGALVHAGVERVPAWELVVRAGTMVEVVGEKTTTPDASGDGGGYREPPRRATLQSGAALPLVITPLPLG